MGGRPFDFSTTTIDAARVRQDGLCAACGNNLNDIAEEAHHAIPNQAGDPDNAEHAWLSTERNCVVLCDHCHDRAHEDAKFQKGAVFSAGAYKFSHGKRGGNARTTWVADLETRAKRLYASPRPAGGAATRVGVGRTRACVRSTSVGAGLFIAGLIAQHYRKKLEQDVLDKQLVELEPEMVSRISRMRIDRAKIQSDGGTPFAIITVSVTVVVTTEYGQGRPLKDATLPLLTLDTIEIRRFSVATTNSSPVKKRGPYNQTEEFSSTCQWSVPADFSAEEIREFTELSEAMKWCGNALADSHLVPEDRVRIEQELAQRRASLEGWVNK